MMGNLTISTDNEVLKKARLRAIQEGTSVNAVLRKFMETYAGVRNEQSRAAHDLLTLAKASKAGSGGHSWTRDELHERR